MSAQRADQFAQGITVNINDVADEHTWLSIGSFSVMEEAQVQAALSTSTIRTKAGRSITGDNVCSRVIEWGVVDKTSQEYDIKRGN